MSIRLRLTAWYTGILAVTLILFSASIYGLVYYNTYQEVKNRVIEQADQILKTQNITVTQGWDMQLDPDQIIRLEDARIFWQLNNYVIGTYRTSPGLRERKISFPIPEMKDIQNGKFQPITINGNSYMLYERALGLNDHTIVGLLQLAADTNAEDRLMKQMRTVILFGSLFTIVIASSLGLFLARKSMAPIGKVIEAANGIQTGNDLSVRIDYDGPNDEIGRLIGTVNRMLERTEGFYKELEEAYSAQRRFVSDASHELRTPLTTIRGNVDLLKKMWSQEAEKHDPAEEERIRSYSVEAVSDISAESERMSRLVNDMLSLARADAGQTVAKEPLMLQPVVEEVVRRAQFLPRKAEWITGNLDALAGAVVMGSKDYLQQMLFIFIENAFKYTEKGSVTIDALRSGDQIGIRIADTGIGMDRSEVPHIFERFYRADPSRGVIQGTGLGLSIAKWIIDEHGGSVEVMTKLGQGTTFVIWLPASFNGLPE
ncbi:HAMP domain-containing protein [Paenibacillus macerans]|uniref:histidine kinase n=1 Tax=Paenibacillus macerans TaxID=44252 RepID=A0A6N8F531_PAEMA|nr:HAMP domain-containing sensor histidine kinase [Paenibacillus macerans]MED4957038.1 HAMP domain-containing sensor histidine kinase [Paenibacillus macerans]MUG25923.1 HAMP domain-containing protein [Paenibacillus macerans]